MSNYNIFVPTDILVPKEELLGRWSVIACDQFSSQPEYWERVKAFVGSSPSAFNLIIPEAYLAQTDETEQTKFISQTMEEYIKSNVFREYKDTLIYIERTQTDGRIRRGLIGAIDLEAYDFNTNTTPIRASEGTILERLPARVNIRKTAQLEMPHIIAFIDDKEETVIEPIDSIKNELPKVYDFDLMEGGGHIIGWAVSSVSSDRIMKSLGMLGDRESIAMIIGDGNHSLAGAKVYWDELKKGLSEPERESHPARRALVEVCNVYDSAIDFEAIHRVLFDIDTDDFITMFEKAMPRGNDFILHWVTKDKSGKIGIKAGCIGDMLVLMQDYIDGYIKENSGSIDYVHGEEDTRRLAQGKRCLGLILPGMDKSDIFRTVEMRGVFPRKSFSVGYAKDKRYYLECRKIK